eukprot:jgi/Mesen1/9924/ME000070S09213
MCTIARGNACATACFDVRELVHACVHAHVNVHVNACLLPYFASVCACVNFYVCDVLVTGGLLSLSEQQVLDCQGRDKCTGGWPSDALEYAANATKPSGGLALDSTYKYAGSAHACSAAQEKQGRAGVAMWEEVNFIGWFGLLLAVQNQPLVVSVAASSPSFVSYVKVSG